jgi:hypothetical protein
LGGGFGYLFRFSSQALSLSVVFRPLAQVGFWFGRVSVWQRFRFNQVRSLSLGCVASVKLLAGIGFDSSQSAWLAISAFGRVRFLKSASRGLKKFWQVCVRFFGQVSLCNQGYGRLWLLLGQRVFQKSFISASQVLFFALVVVSFGWSNWVLPKSEFVVKCGQEGCGSGFWSRSLAQPENA